MPPTIILDLYILFAVLSTFVSCIFMVGIFLFCFMYLSYEVHFYICPCLFFMVLLAVGSSIVYLFTFQLILS